MNDIYSTLAVITVNTSPITFTLRKLPSPKDLMIVDGTGEAASKNIIIESACGKISGYDTFVINEDGGHIIFHFDGSQWNKK